MVLVETERLFIRDWVRDDWKRYKPLATDPRVLNYIGVEPSPDERIKAFVNGGIETAKRRGWILWPVIHRDDAELIGFCGFNDGFPPDVELGWRLRPDYWGRGLATEIARAVMEYGWPVLPRIVLGLRALLRGLASFPLPGFLWEGQGMAG
jgi:RimJ/RimL family protein N-acetyltransferase